MGEELNPLYYRDVQTFKQKTSHFFLVKTFVAFPGHKSVNFFPVDVYVLNDECELLTSVFNYLHLQGEKTKY